MGGKVRFLEFVVPGIPVAKRRPRFSRRGKFVKVHTDEKTVRYEEVITSYAREAMRKEGFAVDGPVAVSIVAVFQRPKSRKKNALMDRKPDLDNVCKSVIDGISNAGAIKNDSRVVMIAARKEYGELPETRVAVEEFTQ